MNKKNKHFFKFFAYCFAAYLLLNNITFAEEVNNPATNIKAIKQEIKENIRNKEQDRQKIIDLYWQLFISQMDSKLYDDAIKTSLKLEALNADLHGENSNEAFNSKMETIHLYTITKNEPLRKQKIEEVGNLVTDADNNLKYAYYNALYELYATQENEYEGNKVLKKMYDMPSLTKEEKYNVISKYINNYSYMRDIKNTNKYIEEYLKLVNTYDKNDHLKYSYIFEKQIYLNNDVQHLYKNFMRIYTKAYNYISQFSDAESKDYLVRLDSSLINNYLILGELDKAKAKIEQYPERNKDDIYTKNFLNYAYYSALRDDKKQEEILNNLEKLYKANNDYKYSEELLLNELRSNIYMSRRDYNAAKRLYLKNVNIINKTLNGSPDKKLTNYLYLAELYISLKDNDKAEQYLDMAANCCNGTDTLEYSRILALKSKIAKDNKDIDNAIKYSLRAEKIRSKVPTSSDITATYEELFDLYMDKKNREKAAEYLDKILKVKALQYGTNNVTYYCNLIREAQFLNVGETKAEAEAIMNKIYSDYLNNKIQGKNYDFDFCINYSLADKNYKQGNYNQAINFADDAVEYAYSSSLKKQIYTLMATIYKRLGNKNQEDKYKTLVKKLT